MPEATKRTTQNCNTRAENYFPCHSLHNTVVLLDRLSICHSVMAALAALLRTLWPGFPTE
jgi:hypothetical protein